MRIFRPITAFLILIAPVLNRADPLETWTWRSPWEVPTSLNSVAYGNGEFMAVKPDGTFLTSTDGLNWNEHQSTWTEGMADFQAGWVVFGNGNFVAMGSGSLYLSDGISLQGESTTVLLAVANGTEWKRELNLWHPIQLLFDGLRFVALLERYDPVTSTTQLRSDTSTDGIDWSTTVTAAPSIAFALIGLRHQVAYGNGRFVGVSTSGSFLVSEDGDKWVERLAEAAVVAIAFGDGRFVALSNYRFDTATSQYEYTILSSVDGTTWSQSRLVSKNFYGYTGGCSFVNGQFLLLGDGDEGSSIASSADDKAWNEQTLGKDVGSLNEVTFGNGRWVGVGDWGVTVASKDGVNWNRRDSVTSASFVSVIYGNGQFVAVGDGIVTSTNGVNWVQRQSPVTNQLSSAAFGDGRFVAAASLREILTSDDAIHWEKHDSGISPLIAGYDYIYSIAFGNGLFVAVTGQVITSKNGVNWVEAKWLEAGGQLWPRCVAFGEGQFVVLGAAGNYLTSTDGVNWKEHLLGTSTYVLGAVYGNGRFVGLGSNNPGWFGADEPTLNFFTSTDGLNWKEQVFGPLIGYDSHFSIAYGNGRFAAVAGPDKGQVLTSSDGLAWTARKITTPQGAAWYDLPAPVWSIAYGDGHFVAAGGHGTILQSNAIINLAVTSGPATGLLTLGVEGPRGLDYTVQSSSDMTLWRDLVKVTNAPSAKTVFEALPAARGNQFYRVLTH